MTAGLSGVDWTKFPGNTKTPLSVTTTPREPASASTILVYHRNSASLGGLTTPTPKHGNARSLIRRDNTVRRTAPSETGDVHMSGWPQDSVVDALTEEWRVIDALLAELDGDQWLAPSNLPGVDGSRHRVPSDRYGITALGHQSAVDQSGRARIAPRPQRDCGVQRGAGSKACGGHRTRTC